MGGVRACVNRTIRQLFGGLEEGGGGAEEGGGCGEGGGGGGGGEGGGGARGRGEGVSCELYTQHGPLSSNTYSHEQ